MVGSLVLAGTVRASIDASNSRETSYKTIVDRNPFGLKPPAPPPPPPVVAPPPKGDIKLTGITAFGSRKAYFMTTDPKGGKPEYYALGVEEKKDGLEVVSIDELSKSVRIRNGGVETLLTFSTHGVAVPPSAASAAPVSPAPGMPGMPGMPGGATTSVNPFANKVITPDMLAAGSSSLTPMRNIPSRTPRGQADTTSQFQVGGLAQRSGFGQTPNNSIPQPAAQQSNLSSEEQILLLELQKVANPHLDLPPTPGLPPIQATPIAPNQPGFGLPGQPYPGLPGRIR